MYEVDDVKRKIVMDHVSGKKLHANSKSYYKCEWKFAREYKPNNHRSAVREGIKDAVANVALCQRLLAVVLNDHRGIL